MKRVVGPAVAGTWYPASQDALAREVDGYLVPPDDAPGGRVIALIEPCDGVASPHEVIRTHKDWRDVPMFAPDPPYSRDERSIDYFADELREMVVFLEEHTGHKLEMDRLREVFPTPGGPTKQRIGPFVFFLSFLTARYSRIRSVIFSSP